MKTLHTLQKGRATSGTIRNLVWQIVGKMQITMTTPLQRVHLWWVVGFASLVLGVSKMTVYSQWLAPWLYRKPIIYTYTGNPAPAVFKVIINTQDLISQGKMRTDCGDLRFTLKDGTTLLHYYIEQGCNTPNTEVWVRFPQLVPAPSDTFYFYYGNAGATSVSNPDSVFEFFATSFPEDTIPNAPALPVISDLWATYWSDAGCDRFDIYGYTDVFATSNLSGSFLNDIVIDPPESGGDLVDTLTLAGRTWLAVKDMHKLLTTSNTLGEGVLRTILLPVSDFQPYSVRRHGNLGCDAWCSYYSWIVNCPDGSQIRVHRSLQSGCEKVLYAAYSPVSLTANYSWSSDNLTISLTNVVGALVIYLIPSQFSDNNTDVNNYLCAQAAFWNQLDSVLWVMVQDSFIAAYPVYDKDSLQVLGAGFEEVGCMLFPPPDTTVLIHEGQGLQVANPDPAGVYVWYDCQTQDSVGEGPLFNVPYSGWFALFTADSTVYPNCGATSACYPVCIDNLAPVLTPVDSYFIAFVQLPTSVNATYIWVDCDSQRIVDTTLWNWWLPPYPGNFQVIVQAYDAACVDTSSCVRTSWGFPTGIVHNPLVEGEQWRIGFDAPQRLLRIQTEVPLMLRLVTIEGKQLQVWTVQPGLTTIPLGRQIPEGYYLLQVQEQVPARDIVRGQIAKLIVY